MKKLAMISVVFAVVWLNGNHAAAQEAADSDKVITWADSHPELAEIFGDPFTTAGQQHRKESFVPWPLVGVAQTPVGAIQPVVFKGPNGQLIANGAEQIVGSTDGGHTWTILGSPPLTPIPRDGLKHLVTRLNGCGITKNGTMVVQISAQYNDGRPYEGLIDPTYHTDLFVSRSTDGGKTWEPRVQLNKSPHENAGGHQTRFFHLPDGKIGLSMGAWYQTITGEPMALSEMYERTFIWSSSDEGKTWQQSEKPICLYGAEPDILMLKSGRILAAVRYQRHKLPHDPVDLASPHLMRYDAKGFWYKPPYTKARKVGHGLVARLTAVFHSDDNGKTWSKPRLVTGFDEQTGCLVQLSDGTVILVFGHKTDGLGQRFMLSYDDGETWSRKVYQLHRTGQYASSVVLDDDTIITVIFKGKNRYIHALRWRAPSREEVAEGGFWKPRVAEPLGVIRPASTWTTWEDSHPEVVELFGKPLTPLPVEFRTAQIPANQPTMAIGPNDYLYVNSYSPRGWDMGMVGRSVDGGKTWSHIGKPLDVRFFSPKGYKNIHSRVNGMGVTSKNTLLLLFTDWYNKGGVTTDQDPDYHSDVYVARSDDNGNTWNSVKLNDSRVEWSGGNVTRFARLSDGVMALLMPVQPRATKAGSVPKDERYDRTYMWTSKDDGRTWQRSEKPICFYACEPDLLELPSGRLLAAIRYQRYKFSHDPANLASPHIMRNDAPPYSKSKNIAEGFAIRATAILWSDDRGKTWTEPRLLTALDEQTGCLTRLSDGTVLVVFGSKNNQLGQRCMISYDDGETWSKTIYDIHTGGMYASSVTLKDDTVVTIIDNREISDKGLPVLNLTLGAMRWKVPPREEVAKGGFWKPRVVEPLGIQRSSRLTGKN